MSSSQVGDSTLDPFHSRQVRVVLHCRGMARRAGWTGLQWASFYLTGLVAAFVGQTVTHNVLQPSEALPMARAVETRKAMAAAKEAIGAAPKDAGPERS
jgi:hypothetical protein